MSEKGYLNHAKENFAYFQATAPHRQEKNRAVRGTLDDRRAP
jgi:hypothetical protein